MPRPKTIHITPSDMLRGLHRALREELEHATAQHVFYSRQYKATRDIGTWQVVCNCKDDIEALESRGALYDLERWAERTLSPSARLRAQQAVRALERDGLVQIFGVRATSAKLTPAGLAAVEAETR